MGRAASHSTSRVTDAFAELFGNRRGSTRPDEGPAAPMFVGGADDGPLVILEGVVSGRGVVDAVKSVRLAAEGTLTWSKHEVFDRVRGGEQVTIRVCLGEEMDWVDYLNAHGWQAKPVVPKGMMDVAVRISATQMTALRQFADEHGGQILLGNS